MRARTHARGNTHEGKIFRIFRNYLIINILQNRLLPAVYRVLTENGPVGVSRALSASSTPAGVCPRVLVFACVITLSLFA